MVFLLDFGSIFFRRIRFESGALGLITTHDLARTEIADALGARARLQIPERVITGLAPHAAGLAPA